MKFEIRNKYILHNSMLRTLSPVLLDIVDIGGSFLETNNSLWDQQAFAWIRVIKQTFPWILIRYIRSRSDQNQVIGGGKAYDRSSV
jgi:hypothetical protein